MTGEQGRDASEIKYIINTHKHGMIGDNSEIVNFIIEKSTR